MIENTFANKKLLLIGATSYFVDAIKIAKQMGLYTICTDYNPNAIAKKYADLSYDVDTTDKEAILKLAIENSVDGIFVGWSDINLYTAQYVCEKLHLPFYAEKHQLDCTINKDMFKDMCRRNGVPCTKEYKVTEEFLKDDLGKIEYPVIVKPVDNGGTRGISVCNDLDELKIAYKKALSYSKKKKIIVEQFLENKGKTISVKYIIRRGKPYLLSIGDRRVLDAHHGNALITSASIYPASITEKYIKTLDKKVKEMLEREGFKNGQLFMEAIPADDGIYFYEMGYRLSGGITYRITDKLTGINGLKMLINFAMTGEMCTEEEANLIDPFMQHKAACSFAVLMSEGTISRIEGLEDVKTMRNVIDCTQYYRIGETVEKKDIGNVGQMFARITTVGNTRMECAETVKEIQNLLKIISTEEKNMFLTSFNAEDILEEY